MRDAIPGIEAGAATHIGNVRQHNEDNYILATQRGFWAVADGMGGHEAGDVASRIVIEELDTIVEPSTAAELLASCEARMIVANSRLKKLSDERDGATLGTTVAVLLAFDAFYAGVWSGDSRILSNSSAKHRTDIARSFGGSGARFGGQTQCRGGPKVAAKERHNPCHRGPRQS